MKQNIRNETVKRLKISADSSYLRLVENLRRLLESVKLVRADGLEDYGENRLSIIIETVRSLESSNSFLKKNLVPVRCEARMVLGTNAITAARAANARVKRRKSISNVEGSRIS
jgi:predicted house-cleaning noncanonical NTP pyrophosphatase (MazG superfamily)